MSDEIDAPVDAVNPSRPDSVVDRISPEASTDELVGRKHTVLRAGDAGDPEVGTRPNPHSASHVSSPNPFAA
jgi:hypothetical protein